MKDMTRSQLEEYDAVTGGPHFVDPLSVVALFHFFQIILVIRLLLCRMKLQ